MRQISRPVLFLLMVGLGTTDLAAMSSRLVERNAVAGAAIPEALRGQELRPLSLASGDFDGDGVADLAAGFASPEGGVVVLYRGNVDALYPNSPEARQRRVQGSPVGEPFLPMDRVLVLTAPPDFLFAGDFDADGHADLAAAAREGTSIHLLSGDGNGGFLPERHVGLPAGVTAIDSGEFGRRDGLPDLAVAAGTHALIFQAPEGALSAAPSLVALPFAVTSVSLGDFSAGRRRQVALTGRGGRVLLLDSEAPRSWRLVEPETREELDAASAALAASPRAVTAGAAASLSMRMSEHAPQGQVLLRPNGLLSVLVPAVGATVTVNSQLNTNARDAVVTLNEAIRIVIGTLAVGTLTPQELAQVSGTPANPGLDAIHFSIPGAGTPIIVGTLPTISDAVTIDGTTQPGGWVEIDGTSATGLNLTGGGSTVRGMVLYGWSDAISLDTLGGNLIEGNILGLDASGAALQTNNTGVEVLSPNNLIGGTAPTARNVISNSTAYGIYFGDATATNNMVQGNFIGTDLTGNADPSTSAGRGIRAFAGGGNTIGGAAPGAGNVISGNGSQGVRLDTDGNLVQGNLVGVNAAGDAALGNESYGIWVQGADTTIGGTAPGAGNVIAGNEADGIAVDASAPLNCVVQGNHIGINAAGAAAIPNVGHGVYVIGTSGTQIGGTSAEAGNLISGNYLSGISLINSLGTVPIGTVIQGNVIGTDATGTLAVANLENGVELGSALGTVLGGAAGGAGNLISGNLGYGIRVYGSASANPNLIRGNLIGTDIFGTGPLGNGLAGMYFSNNTSGHLTGGAAPGEANTIAFNAGAAVASAAGREIHLFPNRIFGNGGLGIDLYDDGPTPNSAGRSNNFPLLTGATTSSGGTTVAGTLDALASTTFDVYLFSSVTCDPSGYGEGRDYVGATTLTTAANGQGGFSTVVNPPLPGGRYVTAFAKAPSALGHDASEFSFCRQIAGTAPPGATPLGVSVIAPDQGGNTGSVTVKVTGEGMLPGAGLRLARSGQADIVGTNIAVAADGLSLSAVLPLAAAAQRVWDVVVVNPGNVTATLPAAFTVEAGTEPEIWADILGRGSLVVRNGREQTFFLVYGNRGNTDSHPTKFRVTIPWQLRVTFVEELNGSKPVVSVDKPLVTGGTGDSTIEFHVRSIPANSSRTLAFRLLTIAAEPGEFGQQLELKFWHMTSPELGYVFGPVDPNVTLTPTLIDDSPGHLQARIHVTNGSTSGDILFEMTATSVSFESDPFVTKAVNGNQVSYRYRVAFSSSPPSAYEVAIDGASEAVQLAAQGTRAAISEAYNRETQNAVDASGMAGGDIAKSVSEAASVLRNVANTLPQLPIVDAPPPGPVVDVLNDDVGSRICDAVRIAADSTSGAAQTSCDQIRRDFDRDFGSCPASGNGPRAPLLCPFPGVRSGGRYVTVYQAIDPNEKSGPNGTGDPSHYVGGATPIPYTITFENLESANAAAQEVLVTDQLDAASLDFSTLELGPIAFGERVVNVPPGSTSFTGDVDLRPGLDLIVRVLAGFDAGTGLLTWRFFSLDPATGQPTEDPILGFLPPNVESPEGEGHVTFTVNPQSGLATGTQIHNHASIVFDANPAIQTQSWLNTIDVTPPASQVAALPASSCSAISVQWSGSDAHSGIASYDVYVSENGAASALWRNSTTKTSGTFFGTVGASYAFYSVARDGAGNEEAAPASADASTTAGSHSPLMDFLAPVSGPAAGVSVSITGTGFEPGATLSVGGVPATGVTVNGPTSITATFPTLAAGALYDVVATNASSCADTFVRAWLADFTDVPDSHLFHDFVEKIFRVGVTAGCSGGNYCPDNPVTRAQMAAFLIKAKHHGFLTPPAATGLFTDVPPGSFAADWIEQLANEGVTGGCGGGNYCPGNSVTRAQMAVFLLKSRHGALYVPAAATGVFADVPPGSFAADWIEQLAAEGITGGCGGANYCPNNPVTRGQMAVFLSKTFEF